MHEILQSGLKNFITTEHCFVNNYLIEQSLLMGVVWKCHRQILIPLRIFTLRPMLLVVLLIDGLASIWESISQCQYSGNRKRFTAFLIHLDTHSQMERICTPFLVFFLKKQGIEEPFANEVKARWMENRRERESHRVYADPTVSELKTIYEDCHRQHPISDALSFRNPDSAISSLTYAALIYKFYRCSFVHEFRASQLATFFNRNNEISIREFASSISPSGVVTQFDEVKPQLDIGIGVLTECIRRGADNVFKLIVDKQCKDIPYGSNDEIKFQVK
jgi:hypothetical protein